LQRGQPAHNSNFLWSVRARLEQARVRWREFI